MNLESFLKKFGVWLLFSFIFLLIGIVRWDVTPYIAILLAGMWGLILFMRLDLYAGKSAVIVEKITSLDGTVTATIEEWKDKTGKRYDGKVKRNYQDGVFAKEEEFVDLEEAKLWLASTYQQELEKHLQRIRQSERQNPKH
ncbi:MAG: hypothetical protein CL608_22610 [Anaerolineaceae bacterium]|nr:hypothetical protein [Anaerolineaceae bacterium]